MRPKSVICAVLFLTVALGVGADPVCPCIPTSYEWIVTPCETWKCAASALVIAGGDPYVISAPTNVAQYPWVVMRRIVAGAVKVPDDAPFLLEKFDSVTPAASRYLSIDTAHVPLMMTTTDGTSLLVYLRKPEARRRSVGR